MNLPPKVTKKLLIATSDKVSLNRQFMKYKKRFDEVSKMLNEEKKK